MSSEADTATAAYAARLRRLEAVWWKRWLDVQRPYRRHLRALNLGPTLDVGCGRGRNLANLGSRPGDVGVDHNADSVAAARARGLECYVADAFRASARAWPRTFAALLASHVIEHMQSLGLEVVRQYSFPFPRPVGRLFKYNEFVLLARVPERAAR